VREAIRLNPNEPSFYESLADIYWSQFKLDEALDWLKRAMEVRTTPSTDPSTYFMLGNMYILRFFKTKSEEDFNEAIKWLKKAIEIKPTYALAYSALGRAYQAHSNADEALASFSKAIEYNPKDIYTYIELARVYSELKHDDDAAIERLQRATELKPDFKEGDWKVAYGTYWQLGCANAYWQLGLAYQRKKNDTEAIKHLLKAIEVNPKYLQTYLDLASISRVQKNYPEAIKHLNKAIEIAPTASEPYEELAKVYEDQRKNEEAVHYYEEASNRLRADDSFTKNLYLGRIARLQSRYEEAIGYFQTLQPPPWKPVGQVQYEVGLTYVASKNSAAALQQHKQLVQLKSPLAEELLRKIKEMK
jgi:tetratricopeptide (TPR) repeat protein